MIECNIFNIEVEIEETIKQKLSWNYFTDLPCGTSVIISIYRHYKDHDDNNCVWILFDNRSEVIRTDRGDLNGNCGELIVDNADSNALKEFNKRLSSFSAGIKTPVSDAISISATVGARQPLKAFGKNNINMTGTKVVTSGKINVVKVLESIIVPIKSQFQPIDFNKRNKT